MPESGKGNNVASIKWTSTFVVGTLIVVCVITPSAETSSMRLCGQKLTRTLLAVCNNKLCGGFAADELAKRGDLAGFFGHFEGRRLLESEGNAVEETRRLKRELASSGIATECCTNKCSFNYLKTFCCEER
uniref:Insulin-like domain-containing protein n=1 Tax=Plectus sambesii TaxID=2011161 RepID=A0A914WFL0_9BILA